MLGGGSSSAKLFVLCFPLFCSVGAYAETFADSDGTTEFRIEAGILNGESGEYLYDANGSYSGRKGYKISELNWQLNSVPMLGLGFTFPAADQLRLNLDYWRNVVDGDGTMDDYDWLYVGADWSHWSHHSDTTVREVSTLDASLELGVYRTNGDDTEIHVLLGYRMDNLDWQATGGRGIYSVDSYRDTAVSFPAVPVIAYEQHYSSPYFGIGFDAANSRGGMDMLFSGSIRYSPWVQGKDEDIHYLRDLRFEEEGSDGEWLAVELELDVAISSRLSVLLGYSYQEYREIKASMVVTDLTTGDRGYYPDGSAGLDHFSNMFTLGAKFHF